MISVQYCSLSASPLFESLILVYGWICDAFDSLQVSKPFTAKQSLYILTTKSVFILKPNHNHRRPGPNSRVLIQLVQQSCRSQLYPYSHQIRGNNAASDLIEYIPVPAAGHVDTLNTIVETNYRGCNNSQSYGVEKE
jgi:hypothetical protein